MTKEILWGPFFFSLACDARASLVKYHPIFRNAYECVRGGIIECWRICTRISTSNKRWNVRLLQMSLPLSLNLFVHRTQTHAVPIYLSFRRRHHRRPAYACTANSPHGCLLKGYYFRAKCAAAMKSSARWANLYLFCIYMYGLAVASRLVTGDRIAAHISAPKTTEKCILTTNENKIVFQHCLCLFSDSFH